MICFKNVWKPDQNFHFLLMHLEGSSSINTTQNFHDFYIQRRKMARFALTVFYLKILVRAGMGLIFSTFFSNHLNQLGQKLSRNFKIMQSLLMCTILLLSLQHISA